MNKLGLEHGSISFGTRIPQSCAPYARQDVVDPRNETRTRRYSYRDLEETYGKSSIHMCSFVDYGIVVLI